MAEPRARPRTLAGAANARRFRVGLADGPTWPRTLRPRMRDDPPATADLAVVGAGILGLAVARELLHRDGSRRVVVTL